MMKQDLQQRVAIAGLEILEVRITHLSYAPEIAAAMLQRQQAEAIVAARKKIVEGAVGMVEMALEQLQDQRIVDLDEERKAAMVSQPAGGALRQQGRPAHCEQRVHLLNQRQ